MTRRSAGSRERGTPGSKRNKRPTGLSPEVRASIAEFFSDVRQEVASEMPKDKGAFKRLLSRADYERAVRLVESRDFGRPSLTEKLSDEVLASYVFLLKSGDKELGELFKELSDWHSGLRSLRRANP